MIKNFISKTILFFILISGCFYASGQTKIIITGENAISTTDPYAADVLIGSDMGVRHNSSIMFWSYGSASRVFNSADVFYFSVWNTTNPNVALGAALGATSFFQGNVGIGTATPDAKLAVNGTIHTKQIIVDMNGWPDYVFKPSYLLRPISEVKTYINQNHHLPDMPSEGEVIKNGIDLGEIVKLQTKKIEELTLYLIQLKEENEKIRNENQLIFKALESKIKSLSGK